MMKRLLQICFVVLLALAFAFSWNKVSRARAAARQAQTPAQIFPFTALVVNASFEPGSSIATQTEVRTFAVRSDGSTVELFHRPDPSGTGRTLYIRKIIDVQGKRKVVVDPFSESTTTYPLQDKAVAFHAAKPISACGGLQDGAQLGYPVARIEETLGPEDTGPMIDKIAVRAWLPLKLNCIPIRRESVFFKGGKELQHNLDSFVSVSEGEPDPSLFEVPTNYVERAPSAAMAEAFRRFPNDRSFDCGTCDQSQKDAAYSHARQFHKPQ